MGNDPIHARSEQGAAAVEFALLLPILLVVLLGTIEFGLAFFTQEVLTNASREGARAGIIQAVPKPTIGAIQTVVTNYLTTAGINTANIISNNVTGAGGTFGTFLTVQVIYRYDFQVLPNFVPGVPANINLTATTVMAHE
jgi:Flp pilus assembly protein TadG